MGNILEMGDIESERYREWEIQGVGNIKNRRYRK